MKKSTAIDLSVPCYTGITFIDLTKMFILNGFAHGPGPNSHIRLNVHSL